jgi:hypothetical protein
MTDAVAAAAALGAVPASSPGTLSPGPLGEAAPSIFSEKRKRLARPKIDIDAKITDLSVDIAKAQKLLKETKTLQRNERRKKQRLIKKAAGLSSNDLERIAVIKRCGLWDPALGVTFDFTGSVELVTAAAAAVGEAVAVTGGAVPSVVALSSAAASAEAHCESEEEEAAAE